jgi:ABC-type transport system involved in cytochrome c biogenesis permease component
MIQDLVSLPLCVPLLGFTVQSQMTQELHALFVSQFTLNSLALCFEVVFLISAEVWWTVQVWDFYAECLGFVFGL